MSPNHHNTNQIHRNFHAALTACLDALYPGRPQWGNKPNANAVVVNKIHLALIDQDEYLTGNQIQNLYEIVKAENKQSCCSCWPWHFSKPDPFVESLCSALDKIGASKSGLASIGNIPLATQALNALLARVQLLTTTPALPNERTALAAKK